MKRSMTKRDDDGAVAILTVGAMGLLFAMLVVTVDFGMLYFLRRNLQGAADAAALSASLDPGNSRTLAITAVTTNGFTPDAVRSVETGVWTGDTKIAATARFQPNAASPNAVRIGLTAESPLFFMRYFKAQDSATVTAFATAAHVPEASFSAGTGLARIDDGLLNAVLGGLLGSNLNLRVMDYEGLLLADVNLLRMLDALAIRLNLNTGNYDQLLTTTVTVAEVLRAAVSALADPANRTITSIEAQAINALQVLQLQVRGNPSLKLGDLLNLGIWSTLPVGTGATPTALHAKLAVFDLVSLTAQVANGKNMVDIGLPSSIPGVATVNLKLTIGEGEQRIGLGPIGTSLHTAQTRLLLDLQLLPVLGNLVRLPLYIEVASGTTRLDAVTCGSDPRNDARVTLGASTGLAHLQIGEVSDANMRNFTKPVAPKPAKLVNVLGLIYIVATADAKAGAGSYTPVSFTQPDIEARTRKEVGSSQILSGLVGSLVTSLRIEPDGLVGILLAPVVNTLIATLKPILTAVIGALGVVDGLLDTVLRALGMRLGVMDVAVLGVRCGVPVLVH